MGMLETRNLDFEEVILLCVNEGSLPSSSHSPSFFTFDVRRVYGLACQNERDAVTAYHFYRLIQRAKNVHLIFDQDSTSFGSGEVSRYVQQLRSEAPDNVKFHEKSVAQKLPKKDLDNEISIDKGAMEYEALLKHAERGYSPSALNTYRSCSLKYYMRYVAKFKEDDELTEEVDNATFGTSVHDTLEQLYLPTLGKPLTEQVLNEMSQKIDAVLENQFAKHVPIAAIRQGKNLLAFEVARAYVNRVLENDLEMVRNAMPTTVLQLEQKLEGAIDLKINGTELKVNLSGLADRIDRTHSGDIRLIDYKTGSPSKTTEIANREALDKNKADNAFQLLLYQFLYAEMTNTHQARPTLFYLRSQNIEKPVTVENEKVPVVGIELTEYTKNVLLEILQELFSKEIPFTQTEDMEACTYCDFKEMCQR
jgi:CRISPR/Cas system-associated exonuclease Cas4 (RecB family)